MSRKVNKIAYKEYLDSLNKSDITNVLDTYFIEYKKSQSKDALINLLISNVDFITSESINYFRKEELLFLKKIIKKKGYIRFRHNKLLLNFCNYIQDKLLIKMIGPNEYLMPNEVYLSFKQKLKSKKINELVKNNTIESSLILGFTDAYGVCGFDFFYNEYTKKFKYQKEDAIKRLNKWQRLYNEFKLLDNKYICSNQIKNIKEAEKYINNTSKYAVYTNEELIKIHNFEYYEKSKPYKKFISFVTKLYDVNKDGIKIINKHVLNPYNAYYQYNKTKAKSVLNNLLNEYFEPYKDKYKEKLITYINDLMEECPKWKYKGNIRKDGKNE